MRMEMLNFKNSHFYTFTHVFQCISNFILSYHNAYSIIIVEINDLYLGFFNCTKHSTLTRGNITEQIILKVRYLL